MAPRDGGIGSENLASFESIEHRNQEKREGVIDPNVAFAEEYPG